MADNYLYDVAVSFAGEDLAEVEKLVTDLDYTKNIRSEHKRVAEYFKSGLAQLESSNAACDIDFEEVRSGCFGANIYRDGERVNEMKVFIGGVDGNRSISYRMDREVSRSDDSTTNGWLTLEEAGMELVLKYHGMSAHAQGWNGKAKEPDACEIIWMEFINSLEYW